MKKYDAILFDLDDTLYSRVKAAEKTFPGMFRAHLYPDADEAFIQKAVAYMMTKVKKDSMIHEESFGALLEKYPSTVPYEREACIDYYYAHLADFAEPFDETYEVLSNLRKEGILTGIVTNVAADRVDSQWRKIKNMKLDPYFDTILMSGEEGICKPDPRIFRLAAQRLGVKAENCLFVGDDPNSDIKGALETGMDAVWIDIYPNTGVYDNNPRVTRVRRLSHYFK